MLGLGWLIYVSKTHLVPHGAVVVVSSTISSWSLRLIVSREWRQSNFFPFDVSCASINLSDFGAYRVEVRLGEHAAGSEEDFLSTQNYTANVTVHENFDWTSFEVLLTCNINQRDHLTTSFFSAPFPIERRRLAEIRPKGPVYQWVDVSPTRIKDFFRNGVELNEKQLVFTISNQFWIQISISNYGDGQNKMRRQAQGAMFMLHFYCIW